MPQANRRQAKKQSAVDCKKLRLRVKPYRPKKADLTSSVLASRKSQDIPKKLNYSMQNYRLALTD